jgi:hypothetical protein
MRPERVFDDPAAHHINWGDALGIDEELLPANGAADRGGELGGLESVHR